MKNKEAFRILLLSFCCLSLSACMNISKEAAGLKANTYIQKNLLQNGLESKVDNVTDGGSFFEVDLQVIKNGKPADNAKVFVSKDGSLLSLGPTYNLNKPHLSQVANKSTSSKTAKIPQRQKPTIEMYVMSGCPFGLQAEESLEPVVKLLKDKINFTPHFIFYKKYRGGGSNYCLDEENRFCSMHGVEEAREDIRQLCIWNQQKTKWWDYIQKFNKECSIDQTTGITANCSKKVATKVGLNFAQIEKCLKVSAQKLAAKEQSLTEKKGISGSPTILINGTRYNGSREPNTILSTICNSFKGKKPQACKRKIAGGNVNKAASQGGCGT